MQRTDNISSPTLNEENILAAIRELKRERKKLMEDKAAYKTFEAAIAHYDKLIAACEKELGVNE